MFNSKTENKIGAIKKDSEMLRIVPDYLKAKRICKDAAKKFLFIIKYVSDPYTTEQMCDKVILENGGILMIILDCFNNQICAITLLIVMLITRISPRLI